MADKSKNEQYDIVAQAQDVLDLYIKRCFDISHYGKTRSFKKRALNKGALLLYLLAGCCAFTLALIYFLL